ncbi:MAG: 50S ribosomal protein L29 [Candidatus Magasanikbacteria bacterium]|jgi:ribosomal protein L29|nr:50S ribosomal protein L29 [Candidatus Magasanikbacteria bacterium]
MELQELQQKSVQDLRELLAETRQELRELRFKASEGQLKTIHKISVARKTIARILTILRQSELAQA